LCKTAITPAVYHHCAAGVVGRLQRDKSLRSDATLTSLSSAFLFFTVMISVIRTNDLLVPFSGAAAVIETDLCVN